MTRLWKMRPFDRDLADRLARELSLSPLIAQLLVQRGVSDPEVACTFLDPWQDVLHSPFLFSEMEGAVERIDLARKRGERVVVHGDYDVDGISGTAILLEILWQLGIEADYFLPHRIEDGYGLNMERVAQLASEYKLMITVDCGSTSVEEIALAAGKGMDVIVTDHHQPGKNRPPALAILNPGWPGEEYPFAGLSGSGVAYKLACALRESLLGIPEAEEEGLDLVALGTVSDVVPLVDENRTMVSRAIDRLRHEQRAGLKALLEVSSTDPSSLDTSTIGFRIGPRINALGRLADPRKAVELLVTHDAPRAFEIATEMNQLNGKRQAVERKVTLEAHERIAHQRLLEGNPPLLLISGEGWHRGVIGIVAAKLVEYYGRPVVLFSREEAVLHGSGRSLPRLNLASILEPARSYLLSGGGHETAIGLSVEQKHYERVCELMLERARESWGKIIESPPLWIDAELPLERVDEKLVEEISVLAPYGERNPMPVFLFRAGGSTVEAQVVGNNHLRLTLWHVRGRLDAIGFGLGDRLDRLQLDRLEIAATPTVRTYRDSRHVQLRVVDVRTASEKTTAQSTGPKQPPAKPSLDRKRLGVIFRLMRSLAKEAFLSRNDLYRKAAEIDITKEEIYLALIIFVELDLLRTRGDRIELLPSAKKKDLSQSATFRRLSSGGEN